MTFPVTALQTTLKAPIHCTGVGVHTGERSLMTLRPAPADTGIVFRRSLEDGTIAEIPANWSNTIEAPLCTMLTDARGHAVLTVEHLMAALAGCGVDNCFVEVDGPEVPVMDGSAEPFVFLIECAGLVTQRAPRRYIKVLKRVRVGSATSWMAIEPDDGFSIDLEIDFENALIGRQRARYFADRNKFKAEFSRARTFGFLEDVDRLHASGKALGASLENTVVIDGDRVLNEGGLRYRDEFVRHKVLDALGDLALSGVPLIGHVTGFRPSHALNRSLVKALLSDRTAWTSDPHGEEIPSVVEWSEPVRVSA